MTVRLLKLTSVNSFISSTEDEELSSLVDVESSLVAELSSLVVVEDSLVEELSSLVVVEVSLVVVEPSVPLLGEDVLLQDANTHADNKNRKIDFFIAFLNLLFKINGHHNHV